MKRKITAIALILTLLLSGCAKKVSKEPSFTATGKEVQIMSVPFESTATVDTSDNHRVFYEIFVGSFSDSDGDGTGDLRGIINRFDYLNNGYPQSGESLGIEGIWLSPINASPSYHKYDVADYYAIDEKFGTMDDLKELVNIAHERNVKVIMDLVINHSSNRNEWYKEFVRAHQSNDETNPMYDFYTYSKTPVKGRSFSKITGSDDYYECNFSGDMPELNYDNAAVYEEMLNVAKYYLEEVGVDGFRFDAAKYIYYGELSKNVDFWNRYMEDLRKIKPDIYTVAEVWDSDSITDSYFDALNCFNFTTSQASGVIATAAQKGDVNSYVNYISSYLKTINGKNPDAMILPFVANHDMDRASGFLQASNGYAQMAANLYILGPGSPFVYYGEEIGMKGSRGGENTDANRRLAMLWGDGDTIKNPEGSTYDLKKQSNGTVAEQLLQDYSIYNYYKKVIMMRKANPEIFLGDYIPLNIKDSKAGGFVATYEGTSVAVIHNTTLSTVTIDLSQYTDISFDHINSYAGYSVDAPYLEGTVLTLPGQLSVILR